MFLFQKLHFVNFSRHSELLSISLLKLKKRFILSDILVDLRYCKTRGPLIIVIQVLKLQSIAVFEIDCHSHVSHFSHSLKITRLIVLSFVKNYTQIISIQVRLSGEIPVGDEIRLNVLIVVRVRIMSHQNDRKSFQRDYFRVCYAFKCVLRIRTQKLDKKSVNLILFFGIKCLRNFLFEFGFDF